MHLSVIIWIHKLYQVALRRRPRQLPSKKNQKVQIVIYRAFSLLLNGIVNGMA